MLALLLGCGLRRSELVHLTVENLQQREERWVIVDLVGKGGHIRTVPVPAWVKTAIDQWMAVSKIRAGRLFRCVNKTGSVWGTVCGPWYVSLREVLVWRNWLRMICGVPALGSAMKQGENSNRFSFC